MKTVLSILFCSLVFSTICQSFHFEDTNTTLIKNVSQSPAHWYIEIFSDSQTDVVLRWKAHFQNIPSAWQISLDTQDNMTEHIQHTDSSDFTLFGSPEFPQKLIIGAVLENTPGNGTVFFDIYNPSNISEFQTISYHFIIAELGLNELTNEDFIRFENGFILTKDKQDAEFNSYDLSGKLIQSQIKPYFDISTIKKKEMQLLEIKQGHKHVIIKLIK